MFSKPSKPIKFATLCRKETDPLVVQHAAFDLAELDDMRRQGVGISTTNAESSYYDGSEDCSFDIPLDQQRGVDINDLWNQSMDVRRSMSKAGVRSVQVGVGSLE